MSAQTEVPVEGLRILTSLKAQGVPNIVGAVQRLEQDPPKMQDAVRKSLASFLEAHFGVDEAKVFSTSSSSSVRIFNPSFSFTIVWNLIL